MKHTIDDPTVLWLNAVKYQSQTMPTAINHIHEIEDDSQFPTVLIITADGFIASYLAQKLLQLPVRVVMLSGNEIEEAKHLETDPRFRMMTQSEPHQVEVLPDRIEYVVQIMRASGEREEKEMRLANQVAERVSGTTAKYALLRLITKSEAVKRVLSEPQTLSEVGKRYEIEDEFLEAVTEKAIQHQLNLRILNVLHAYGPKMPLAPHWELPSMLLEAYGSERLLLAGGGMAYLYPIAAEDVADATVKAIFTESTSGQTFLIGGAGEISALNLAYKLREAFFAKTSTLKEIEFMPSQTESQTVSDRAIIRHAIAEAQESLAWYPKIDLEDGLSATLRWMDAHAPLILPNPTSPLSPQHKPQRKAFRKPTLKEEGKSHAQEEIQAQEKAPRRMRGVVKGIALSLLLIAMSLPLFVTVNAIVATATLMKAVRNFETSELESARDQAQQSRDFFQKAQSQAIIASAIPLKPARKAADQIYQLAKLGELVALAVEQAANTAAEASQLKSVLLTEQPGNIEVEVLEIGAAAQALHTTLSRLETLLEGDSLSLSLARQAAIRFGTDLAGLKSIRSSLLDLRKFLDLLPPFVGQDGRRTYLVLLQNNAELRPTGGFIGSFAEATFEKGRLLEWSVEDVYVADGQLKGHVEPPWEIKQYLGEAGWYLRDGNWDPDFPSTARQVEWFYEKETGREVDGTIAVNLYVLEDFLRALGPIRLPDYNLDVTAETLYEQAQFQSEAKFFPGSTQKKDFLASVAKQLFFNLESADQGRLLRLGGALAGSLEEGQLLLALHDPEIQQAVHDSGWDGSLKAAACPEEYPRCSTTSIALREANLGVNKANYYIMRSLNLWEDFTSQVPETRLSVVWHNASPENAWPGGAYQVYVRIYTEMEQQFMRALLDGEELYADRISLSAQHGKQVIGVFLTVPTGGGRQLDLVFRKPPLSSGDAKLASSLLLQKQSGTSQDQLLLNVSLPANLRIRTSSLPLEVSGGVATLAQKFSKDLYLFVETEERQ